MKKFRIFHHIDQKTINLMYNEYLPVFILSTGRSGSKYLHTLLSMSDEVQSHHEAFPNLQYFSNYAYHNQAKKDVLTKMVEAARMELVLDAFNNNKIFVESNQCLVFFSYALAELFKKSKFIHIIRHPGDFIVSAIKKGWHLNDSIWEAGRVKSSDRDTWKKMTHIEKLAWTWSETNRFIKDFGTTLNSGRFTVFKIENLYSGRKQIDLLCDFIGIKKKFSDRDIINLQNRKINEIIIHPDEPKNMKKVLKYPKYSKWDNDLKESIKKYIRDLTSEYGYRL
jgi:hypothetical protein